MTDAGFSYSTTDGTSPGTTILKLTGPLTLNSMFEFQGPLRAMRPPVLIIDLGESPYMDSAGLGLLMNQYVSAQNGQRKVLLAGVNGRIAALMGVTHVDKVFPIFATVADAEGSL